MIRSSLPKHQRRFLRSAVVASLALAVASGAGFVASPAIAAKQPSGPKLNLTKPFQTAAAAANKAMDEAKARPDVVAAQGNVTTARTAYQQSRGTARTQAKANYDAAVTALGATLTAEKAQLDAAFAAIGNQDDRYTYGQLAIQLGGLSQDQVIQRRGINAMIESGKPTAADLPRLQFFAGQLAMDARDFTAARTSLHAAVAGGYHENDADAILAEAYLADNQTAQGLTILQQAIDYRGTTPNPAPASWYRRGLGAAYKAGLLDQAGNFANGLVKAHPSADNWAGAVTVVREVGKYPAQETLDLMRLMGRTNSYAEERDFIEYIQAADARRLPGEVQKVVEAGLAAGKLRAGDPFVVEARTTAAARYAADRASLPGFERDARAGAATAATAMGAGDAFLSYGEAGKAAELYALALTKPGVDMPRVLTRLGIAQLDSGKPAEAQATFGRVTGPRAAIARLWAIYAEQRVRAAAPAVAAPVAPAK